MGPGKPYWKTPLGFTGGMSSLSVESVRDGRLEDAEVFDGKEDDTVGDFLSLLDEYKAAVVAAPAAADIPAMMASVVFDMSIR